MRAGAASETIPAPPGAVFELLHDYQRRLEWDTLLCEARLTRGHQTAAKDATSLCRGRMFGCWIAIETRYLIFKPGEIAAVEMINRPPFFDLFAASIRHEPSASGSKVIYRYQFRARPAWLRWFLEPIMAIALKHETAKRLRALGVFMRLNRGR